eukprot:scaffold159168_cov38-Prasinocladus_malaysianus.AAC.2
MAHEGRYLGPVLIARNKIKGSGEAGQVTRYAKAWPHLEGRKLEGPQDSPSLGKNAEVVQHPGI